MENKTAERYKALKTGGETWNVYDGQRGCSILRTLSPNASYNKSTVDEVVSLLNASLQCAEMKTENENLQGSLIKAQKENWLLSVRIKELERVIHMANQMLISYDMRHPEDEDCLVGRSNSEAKEIIEKTLNHDTINKP